MKSFKKKIKRILLKINQIISIIFVPREIFKEEYIWDLYKKEEKLKCYDHFKKFFKNAIFLRRDTIRKYAIEESLKINASEQDNFNLEFGVFKGVSTNFFSKFVDKLYAFDSFEGLREDWSGWNLERGHFDLKNNLPKLNKNVEIVKGWVQDTLDSFLNKHNPKIKFVHMDVDTYESTAFILKKIKPNLIKGAIIIFDELYNFPAWDVGEYKALRETFNENEYTFKAFSIEGKEVVIQIK